MLSRMNLSDFLKGLALKKEEHSMEKIKRKGGVNLWDNIIKPCV